MNPVRVGCAGVAAIDETPFVDRIDIWSIIYCISDSSNYSPWLLWLESKGLFTPSESERKREKIKVQQKSTNIKEKIPFRSLWMGLKGSLTPSESEHESKKKIFDILPLVGVNSKWDFAFSLAFAFTQCEFVLNRLFLSCVLMCY